MRSSTKASSVSLASESLLETLTMSRLAKWRLWDRAANRAGTVSRGLLLRRKLGIRLLMELHNKQITHYVCERAVTHWHTGRVPQSTYDAVPRTLAMNPLPLLPGEAAGWRRLAATGS